MGAHAISAPAKINWALDITGTRADGYHLLDSLMQPLALCDRLLFQPADTLSLSIVGCPGLIPDEKNLVLRAARALAAHTGVKKGVCITLEKHIPMGAGLGGGSADAAAVLRALDEIWHLALPETELYAIGLSLGADVPFCLMNAPARAQGIGERLTPLPCKRSFPLVLLQPCPPLSTKAVFDAWQHAAALPSDMEKCILALQKGDLPLLAENARNGLEQVSIPMRPEIENARQALLQNGAALARMTGSGSVVFGAFEDAPAAKRAWDSLRHNYPVCILTETAL